jgi:hypothetical protein
LDKGGKKYFYFANSKTPLSPLFIEKSDKKGGKKEELAPLSRGGTIFFGAQQKYYSMLFTYKQRKKIALALSTLIYSR